MTPKRSQAYVDGAVWFSPSRMSGQPCIGGTRVPVDMVIGTVWHGGGRGVEDAMFGWDLTRAQVLLACWYAAAYNLEQPFQSRRGPWRRRWEEWALESRSALWGQRFDEVEDPPQVAS